MTALRLALAAAAALAVAACGAADDKPDAPAPGRVERLVAQQDRTTTRDAAFKAADERGKAKAESDLKDAIADEAKRETPAL